MAGSIDMGHARAYLGLETVAAQESVHKEVIKKSLSVRQTEALVKKLKDAVAGKKTRKRLIKQLMPSMSIWPASFKKSWAQGFILKAGARRAR